CVPVCVQLKADGEHLLLPGPWSEHMALHKPEKAAAELAKWSLEALPPAADGSLRARLRISRADARLRANAPFKLAIFCDGEPFWETEPLPTRTLGKPTLSPGCFGWVKFE
ncbi:MAG: hypothetical protein IJC25_00150, partial [Clostridia bacterium]|nr:hypothetical protein [Clostridia bacterium]